MTQTALAPTTPAPTTPAGFLEALRDHSNSPLIFDLGGEKRVPAGYHVTEIKSATLSTVDCGGVLGAWTETVIQLMQGGFDPDAGYMTVEKFLKIYGQVTPKIAIELQSELRFEYGDADQPAVHYAVSRLETGTEGVTVHLDWLGVRCKANDRARAARAAQAPLAELTVLDAAASSCCTPSASSSGCGC